jgi:hypothetical protein
LLQFNVPNGLQPIFLLVIDGYIAPKIRPFMFKLNLPLIFAKDGRPGILFFIFGKVGTINNVYLFNLRLGFLCPTVPTNENS